MARSPLDQIHHQTSCPCRKKPCWQSQSARRILSTAPALSLSFRSAACAFCGDCFFPFKMRWTSQRFFSCVAFRRQNLFRQVTLPQGAVPSCHFDIDKDTSSTSNTTQAESAKMGLMHDNPWVLTEDHTTQQLAVPPTSNILLSCPSIEHPRTRATTHNLSRPKNHPCFAPGVAECTRPSPNRSHHVPPGHSSLDSCSKVHLFLSPPCHPSLAPAPSLHAFIFLPHYSSTIDNIQRHVFQ